MKVIGRMAYFMDKVKILIIIYLNLLKLKIKKYTKIINFLYIININ